MNYTDGLVGRVITKQDDVQKLTFVRNMDARSALARGLEEYLLSLSIVWEGGRVSKFKAGFTSWATPDDPPGTFPSFSIIGYQDGMYDSSNTSPKTTPVDDGTGRYVRQVAGLDQVFQLVLWAQDPVERMALVSMVEDALDPVDWMTGCTIELPYYFGARALYDKQSVGYDDVQADVQKRWRRVIMTINASVPIYRPVGPLPFMQVRQQVEVSEGGL